MKPILFIIGFILFAVNGVYADTSSIATKNYRHEVLKFSQMKKESIMTIQLKVGDVFDCDLEGNSTTGYVWKAVLEDCDKRCVAVQSTIVLPEKSDFVKEETAVGKPSTFRFLIKGKRVGSAVVLLQYARPWEKNLPPLYTHTIKVSVVD